MKSKHARSPPVPHYFQTASMSFTRPSPDTISSSAFTQLLKIYPEVQHAAYKAKVKDPKNLATAQKDHDWRYNQLPGIVAERSTKSASAYLEKDEMVRLTQWKIVHGQHRPFLPSMVKKNESERVKEVTASAFGIQAGTSYSSPSLPDTIDKALREAAKLHGVGPATATLVCSLLDPTNVAFFEDELAEWLCPDIPKLKYTWAEYKALYTETMNLRKRIGLEHRAVELEHVAFVIRHLDLLDEEQRADLMAAKEMDGDAVQERSHHSGSLLAPCPLKSSDTPSPAPGRAKASRRKRNAISEEDVETATDEAKPKTKRRK